MTDKVYRLEDLDVVEVSLVHKGANKRPLLVVKNAEGRPMEDQLNTTTPEPTEVASDPVPAEDPTPSATVGKTLRGELGTSVNTVIQRLQAFAEGLEQGDADAELDAVAKAEAVSLSHAIRHVAEATDVEKCAAIAKALEPRTPAQVNLLKMVPHIVVTPSGPAMVMSPEQLRCYAIDYANSQLWYAQDELYFDNVAKACEHVYNACKTLAPFITHVGVPEGMLAALKAIAGEPATEEVLKEAQPTPSLAEIDAAVQQLAKADEQSKAVERLQAERDADRQAISKMRELLENQQVLIQKLQTSRPVRNSAADYDSTTDPRPRVLWPDDLAAADNSDLDA